VSYRIDIHNFQRSIPADSDEMRRVVGKALKFLEITSAELSVAIVTDRKIHWLNKKYLSHDYPTDVVTFDLADDPGTAEKRVPLDGEIVVSATTALRKSKELGLQPMTELILYVVHGILHLAGLDDKTAKGRQAMREKECAVMSALGFPLNIQRH